MTINITWLKVIILGRNKPKMDNDKEIVWETLQYLKKDISRTHINMIDGHWKGYSEDNRIKYRRLMILGKLINIQNSWDFEITAEGMLAKKNQFNKKGILRFWYTQLFKAIWTVAAISGATAILTVVAQKVADKILPQDRIQMTVVRPTHKMDSIFSQAMHLPMNKQQHSQLQPGKIIKDTLVLKMIK